MTDCVTDAEKLNVDIAEPEEVIPDEEIDAAAELFDGDDSNPLKFIERSVHYQDMLMTKRQATERIEFFSSFEATKKPTAKLREFQARLDRVNTRMTAFEKAYAHRRVVARKQREKRNQQLKEERESYDQLPKTLRTAISKTLQKRKLLASKAAIDAINAVAEADKDASEKTKTEAGFVAFSKTFGIEVNSTSSASKNPDEDSDGGDQDDESTSA